MNHKWLRDGVTTVEVVPTMNKNQSGHVDNTHYDNRISTRSQQGLNSLKSGLDSIIRTNVLGTFVTICHQSTGKLSRWGGV